MAVSKTERWHTNKSAVRGQVKKPVGAVFAGYFYTGPTLHFGHYPPRKSGKKR